MWINCNEKKTCKIQQHNNKENDEVFQISKNLSEHFDKKAELFKNSKAEEEFYK